MAREVQRVYVETSIFGGVFDNEFRTPSRVFFKYIQRPHFQVVVSDVVLREIEPAPSQVRNFLDQVLLTAKVARITQEALELRQAYWDAGILTARSMNDGLHVALATVSRCSMIVSWNFKHIVNLGSIRLFNASNLEQGYGLIEIRTP